MSGFHEMHRSGLLILPNAWDGGSAALMASLGARAIATTSAGVAWAAGWPDGDALPPERQVAAARDIVRAASGLPVSVDMEGGYSDDPAAVAGLAAQLVAVGAAGVNVEDGGGTPELLAAKITAIRAAAGPDLYINARCDLWLRGVGAPAERIAEASWRWDLYRKAGADGLFAPGLADAAGIAELVARIAAPLNLMAMPGLPDARALGVLGVRRLSAGSGVTQAVYGRAAELAARFLTDGDSAPMGERAMAYGAINALMAAG